MTDIETKLEISNRIIEKFYKPKRVKFRYLTNNDGRRVTQCYYKNDNGEIVTDCAFQSPHDEYYKLIGEAISMLRAMGKEIPKELLTR